MSLERHPIFRPPAGPVIVAVMDGVGLGRGDEGDAVARAHTPTLDALLANGPGLRLVAHGRAVGMPSDADMGNSEVGHNALGAGRVFEQGAALVDQAIRSGALYRGEVWRDCVERCLRSREPLHFIGLLSDGNVHSHIDHLIALLEHAAEDGVARARVHVLTDGRDVPRRSALTYIDRLEQTLAGIGRSGLDYRIASGGGRMCTTMDRYEADWSIVARGWATHVHGEARHFASAREAIETLYRESDASDQDLAPFVIVDDAGPVGVIHDGAAVVLVNFRGDRAIEITRAFEEEDFDGFDRGRRPAVLFAGMMQYDGDRRIPAKFLVDPPVIERTMGELLARSGCRQLAIAETHKFGHVTYFWNGNRAAMFDPALERYLEVKSDLGRVEHRPWMKAAEVTDTLIAAIGAGMGVDRPFDLVRVNYANADMVGHTGDLRAAMLAVEAVDLCLARLVAETRRLGGVLVVTADHGNADQMIEGEGSERRVRTSHSLNPVPFAIFDPRRPEGVALNAVGSPGLANVAATVLELLGFRAPVDYSASLLAAP